MLKLAAKVQQIFDSCKQTPIFYLEESFRHKKTARLYKPSGESGQYDCPAN